MNERFTKKWYAVVIQKPFIRFKVCFESKFNVKDDDLL